MANKRNWRCLPLHTVPGVIANAFGNGCLRLLNVDLLVISLSVKMILAVSY